MNFTDPKTHNQINPDLKTGRDQQQQLHIQQQVAVEFNKILVFLLNFEPIRWSIVLFFMINNLYVPVSGQELAPSDSQGCQWVKEPVSRHFFINHPYREV